MPKTRLRTRAGGAPLVALALLLAILSTTLVPRFAHAVCAPGSVLVPGAAYPTGPNPRVALPLDLNEDGILDLAVCVGNAAGSNGNMTVLFGNGSGGMGDGTFTVGPSYGTAAWSLGMASGDFNGDDITDLAVTNHTGASVSILLGNGTGGVGDGSFTPAVSYPIGSHPFGIDVADFNEDGILDLVIADNGANLLTFMRGLGTGGVGTGAFLFSSSLAIPNLPLSVVTGDFDEDGHVDAACTVGYAGAIAVFRGHGDLTFDPFVAYPAGLEPYDLAADDMDGDGITDLIVGNSSIGGVAILRGQGTGGVGDGTFGLPSISGLNVVNAGSVVPADFDGDGIKDVVSAHSAAGRIYFHHGNGDGTLSAPVQVGTGSFPIGMHAADFNGDGLLDLAVPNYLGASVAILNGFCLPGPPGPEPILDDVRDVPNDQGGKVFVTWQRSSMDGVSGTSVTGYRVWRRIPPLAPGSGPSAARERTIRTRLLPAAAGGTRITYWEAMTTLPAQRLEGYGYTSATTQDSMHNSNPYTAFFVTALTANPDVFYDSAVDSGYSVDNLPPGAPLSIAGVYVPGQGFEVGWAAVEDPDVAGYHLHRGGSADFVPSPGNRIAVVGEPGYVDPAGFGEHYYKVAAVDVHENIGGYAILEPASNLDVGPSELAFALHGIQPNPARGGPLRVSFALERDGVAELRLIDLAGRAVASVRAPLGAGRHSVELAAGRALNPGVYFLTLVQGAQSARMKVTILR